MAVTTSTTRKANSCTALWLVFRTSGRAAIKTEVAKTANGPTMMIKYWIRIWRALSLVKKTERATERGINMRTSKSVTQKEDMWSIVVVVGVLGVACGVGSIVFVVVVVVVGVVGVVGLAFCPDVGACAFVSIVSLGGSELDLHSAV